MADEKKSKEKQKAVKSTADKKTAVKKEKAPGGGKIVKFLKDYKSELQKIVWPSREVTMKQSWLVIASLLISSAIIGGMDLGFFALITNVLADLI